MSVDIACASFAKRRTSRHGGSYLSIKALDDVPSSRCLHFVNDLGHLTQHVRGLQLEGSTFRRFEKASRYAGDSAGVRNRSIVVDYAELLGKQAATYKNSLHATTCSRISPQQQVKLCHDGNVG